MGRDPQLQRVIDFYENREDEEARLDTDIGRLEVARMSELMARFLPAPPARILDSGGGTGRYASDLARRGYQVELVDPVPRHVALAVDRASAGPAFSAVVGDARSLVVDAGTFDGALMFGPLYHLPDLGDRMAALAEARRALGQNGVLLAMVITRSSGLLHSLRNDFKDTGFGDVGYFHDPSAAADEVHRAGFEVMAVIGIEGPAWLLDDLADRWKDTSTRRRVLEVAQALEAEPSLLGVSPHVLVVGRRRR